MCNCVVYLSVLSSQFWENRNDSNCEIIHQIKNWILVPWVELLIEESGTDPGFWRGGWLACKEEAAHKVRHEKLINHEKV